MTTVYTDEMMRERLAQARPYTLVVLRRTDKYGTEGTDGIIWDHGRRNMGLQTDGAMPIVCPVRDETDMAGIGIFIDDQDTVKTIMDGDPAVQAGILSYTIHPCRGFPGSALPAEQDLPQRDSVFYSLLDHEWPSACERLVKRLQSA